MFDELDEDQTVEPAKWLTMLEAADLYAAARDLDGLTAKDNILDLIADGRFKLRCQQAFEETDKGPIKWGYRGKRKFVIGSDSPASASQDKPPPTQKRFRPRALGAGYWLRRDGWEIDQSRTDWLSSTIVATQKTKAGNKTIPGSTLQPLRRAANGVEIMRDPDIFPALADEITPSDQEPKIETGSGTGMELELSKQDLTNKSVVKKKRGGGRQPSDDWNDWIAELTLHFHIAGFDLNTSVPSLYASIQDKLREQDKESPPLSKVEKALGVVKRRWVDYINTSTKEDK